MAKSDFAWKNITLVSLSLTENVTLLYKNPSVKSRLSLQGLWFQIHQILDFNLPILFLQQPFHMSSISTDKQVQNKLKASLNNIFLGVAHAIRHP